jgi:hypothetical protein
MSFRRFSNRQYDQRERLGIPVPLGELNSLVRTCSQLKTAVEQITRQKGSILESAITVGDLVRLGVISEDDVKTLFQGGATSEIPKDKVTNQGA